MNEVDLNTLGRAVDRLAEILTLHQASPADEIVRDAVIKRFEFTYEIAKAPSEGSSNSIPST